MPRTATLLLAGGAALAVAALAARPRLLRWGATDAEVAMAMPGDDILPGVRASTMATTIAAPPERVWPWLAQMGCDRAGWYSWDRLDNGGRPSADRVHPEWQAIAAGDRLASTPDGPLWFEVARADAPSALVLRATIDLGAMRSISSDGPRPVRFTDGTWAFRLDPDGAGGTRLVVRGKGAGAPRGLITAANVAFWDPAHVVMQVRQLQNLRRLAAR